MSGRRRTGHVVIVEVAWQVCGLVVREDCPLEYDLCSSL